LLLFLAAPLALAGFGNLILISPQAGGTFHQGDYLNFTLIINNSGIHDGGAVYFTNITFLPNPCINNGEPISLPGAIVCPESAIDPGCVQRFRAAHLQNVFEFRNLSTVEGCGDGMYKFHFMVSGNNEVGMDGSFSSFPKNLTQEFEMNFLGQLKCGDGICTVWKGENCSNCMSDCGRCPECAPGEVSCVNDSVGTCDERGFWGITEECVAGCWGVDEMPRCVTPCIGSSKMCVGENILSVCVAQRWENRSCPYGCIYDDCKGNCDAVGCGDRCTQGLLYTQGTCDHVRGVCSYAGNETCAQGCSEDGGKCAGASGGGGGVDLTLLFGAIAAVVVFGVVYFKFIRKKKEEAPPPPLYPPLELPPELKPPEQKPPDSGQPPLPPPGQKPAW